jgi:ribosomal protein S6--L-glutamate ligase
MSVPLLDNVVALETARDKFETLQILSKSGLPVPETELVRDLDQLAASLQRLSPLPVVIKPLHGSQGQGAILAESEMAAVSMMQSVLFQSREFVLQKYIPCQGIDTRVMVVDGQVVAAMQREAPPGDFRSNLARGGTSRAVEVSEGMSELALRATQELGLNCAGVDIVEGQEGLVILEVNGSPGLSGIEQATGVDVASLWISALESRIEEQKDKKKSWDHV